MPLAETLVDTQQALSELVVDCGMRVLTAMLEKDRFTLCGPLHRADSERRTYRHGHDDGRLVPGGRKVSVRKPRARGIQDKEITLPSWR